jgi:hypothetical protein
MRGYMVTPYPELNNRMKLSTGSKIDNWHTSRKKNGNIIFCLDGYRVDLAVSITDRLSIWAT